MYRRYPRRCPIGILPHRRDGKESQSLMRIMLQNWTPALISGLFAVLGIVAGFGMAQYENQSAIDRLHLTESLNRDRVREERKLQHCEQATKYFEEYINNWNRLLRIASLEKDRFLTDTELERKKKYVNNRDIARDSLLSELDCLLFYLSDKTSLMIEEFRQWDEVTPDVQTSILQCKEYRKNIFKSIKREVLGK